MTREDSNSSSALSFAKGFPNSFQEACLRWWQEFCAARSLGEWGSILIDTATPTDKIYGDEYDIFTPDPFSSLEVFKRLCGASELSDAVSAYISNNGADAVDWHRLITVTIELPKLYANTDSRTKKQKVRSYKKLSEALQALIRTLDDEMKPTQSRTKKQPVSTNPPWLASTIDSGTVPPQLADHAERRKLRSSYLSTHFGLFSDLQSDPVMIRRKHKGRHLSFSTFDLAKVAAAFLSAIQRSIDEELNGPEELQLNKGNAFARFAISQLLPVLRVNAAAEGGAPVAPGTDRLIAALANAAANDSRPDHRLDTRAVQQARTWLQRRQNPQARAVS